MSPIGFTSQKETFHLGIPSQAHANHQPYMEKLEGKQKTPT